MSEKIDVMYKIDDTVQRFNMLPNGSTVVVGVSGGADSICLLDYIFKAKIKKNLKILVSHVNHLLRGEEATRDENFVKLFCQKRNIPIKILKLDVALAAKEKAIGVEECGRNIRYDFFCKLALEERKNNEDKGNVPKVQIATAHTLSDSLETAILNLTKGTSIEGMCGIPAVRECRLKAKKVGVLGNNKEYAAFDVIRPLIYLSKNEVLDYCKRNGLEFIEDSSNFDTKYTRNKIRLNVVPVLRSINENLEASFLRSLELFNQDSAYLDDVADEKFKELEIKNHHYNLPKLKSLDKAIRSRCIKKIISSFDKNIRIDFKHISLIFNIIENGTGAVELPGKICVKVIGDTLSVSDLKEGLLPYDYFSYLFEKKGCDRIYILTEKKVKIIINVVPRKEYDNMRKNGTIEPQNAIDYDNIPDDAEILIRNRKEHDEFSPVNRKCTKLLKKFLNEEKVPIKKRGTLALLACGSTVIWLEGFGVSEKFKVGENTNTVLIIQLENLD
ncbi:MAG: tRNA lysidine(34) synthetase TilS [Clostridia bacterium]|nr:tRNA lysidine(34) synthetase TilS [Clostridia bacterium]